MVFKGARTFDRMPSLKEVAAIRAYVITAAQAAAKPAPASQRRWRRSELYALCADGHAVPNPNTGFATTRR